MHSLTQGVVIVAALTVTAVGIFYLSEHINCVNFFLLKGCVTH